MVVTYVMLNPIGIAGSSADEGRTAAIAAGGA